MRSTEIAFLRRLTEVQREHTDTYTGMATMTRWTKGMATAIALGAVTMLGACNKGDTAADTTAAGMNADTTAMSAGATAAGTTGTAAAASTRMTDAGIFAMLSAANRGEIAAGKMAQDKASSAAVKSFARDMVTDHSRMLDDGSALAKKLNITPNAAAADSILRADSAMSGALAAAPKGAAFDSTYVNGQVAGHQTTLDMVKNAASQAQDAELKNMLNTATGVVQKHLDRIRDIQGKMR